MSGTIVIIIAQDPDVTTPPDQQLARTAEKPSKSVTINFDGDDSAAEVGVRVAQALARLRRCKE